jgi:hypothetical protein
MYYIGVFLTENIKINPNLLHLSKLPLNIFGSVNFFSTFIPDLDPKSNSSNQ